MRFAPSPTEVPVLCLLRAVLPGRAACPRPTSRGRRARAPHVDVTVRSAAHGRQPRSTMECAQKDFPLFPSIPFPHIWSMIIGRTSTNRRFVFYLLFFEKATKTEVTSDLLVPQLYRAVSIIGYVDSVWLRGTGRF